MLQEIIDYINDNKKSIDKEIIEKRYYQKYYSNNDVPAFIKNLSNGNSHNRYLLYDKYYLHIVATLIEYRLRIRLEPYYEGKYYVYEYDDYIKHLMMDKLKKRP